MATGYVLVLAVLVLGGVIATLGDRIGMRVGKARLSLFRLRPRQTATVVSILTGSVISASTLALLFGVSRQLRTGVFELERIQNDLATARASLDAVQGQKRNIEAALTDAQERQKEAQTELQDINQSLKQAVERQQVTEGELGQTQAQLGQLRSQLGTVSGQAQKLRSEIQRLETERATLLQQQQMVRAQIAERDRDIAERDTAIAARDEEIAERDADISQREQRLKQLQAQQTVLQADIKTLEQQYQDLFRGNVVVGRNQPLGSGLIRVNNRQEASQAVDQLLQEANRTAILEIAPGTPSNRQVLLIPQEDVMRLVDRISNGQEYVVRVLSAANYIIGEPCVVAEADPCIQVFIEAVSNTVVYEQNERLAVVSVDSRDLTSQELVEKLNQLIASLQFRARQDGIVGDTLQIANGRTEALIAFLDEVQRSEETLEIRAIAAAPILALGPLRVELLAVSDEGVITRTDELPRVPQAEDSTPPADSDQR